MTSPSADNYTSTRDSVNRLTCSPPTEWSASSLTGPSAVSGIIRAFRTCALIEEVGELGQAIGEAWAGPAEERFAQDRHLSVAEGRSVLPARAGENALCTRQSPNPAPARDDDIGLAGNGFFGRHADAFDIQ